MALKGCVRVESLGSKLVKLVALDEVERELEQAMACVRTLWESLRST